MKKTTKQMTNGEIKPSSRPRRRFNFIDFLLILFVLAIVFVAVNVVSPMSIIDKLKSDTKHTIQYTVEFTGVSAEHLDKIKEADTVVDAVSKQNLGSVTAIDDHKKYSVLEYNEATDMGVPVEHPDKHNVIVTISATATYREGVGYRVNDRRIAVGEKMALRFPDFAQEGYCIGLSIES